MADNYATVVNGTVTAIGTAARQDFAAGIIGPVADFVQVGWRYDARSDSFLPPLTYADKRRAAYPSIGDQLDMIYRAGLGGQEFQDAIAAVKSAFPKP